MNNKQLAREALDNALYKYIEIMGTDADMVDYSVFDEWVNSVTGTENPLEVLDE